MPEHFPGTLYLYIYINVSIYIDRKKYICICVYIYIERGVFVVLQVKAEYRARCLQVWVEHQEELLKCRILKCSLELRHYLKFDRRIAPSTLETCS